MLKKFHEIIKTLLEWVIFFKDDGFADSPAEKLPWDRNPRHAQRLQERRPAIRFHRDVGRRIFMHALCAHIGKSIKFTLYLPEKVKSRLKVT